MKPIAITALLLILLGAPAVAAAPAPQDSDSVYPASFGDAGSFYDQLSPYGEWLQIEGGFYAWRPTHVQYGWRPYLYGHWSWTDYGWYWVSSEPFGWAVFHYGRWYDDDYYGWIWIPDRTWGPAWVEWRSNDDYLGWAPLPPYATFGINMGIRFTAQWFAPYHYWNFVRYRSFASPYLYREVVPIEYSRRLIGTTRSAGRYDFDRGRIINRGIDRNIVERRGGYNRIERIDVRESGSVGERVVRDRNQERIEVYRPDRSGVVRMPARIDARRAERGTTLDLQRIERPPRETGRTVEPQQIDRNRTTVGEQNRSGQGQVQRPGTQPRREEVTQPRRPERRIEMPQGPTVEQRSIERRREERTFSRRGEQPAQDQRRTVASERTQRQDRREVAAPRARVEQSRPAPARQESSRGNERERKDGGRRRN
jgi:hypothetical protein